jgi:hypothetical protein
MKALKFQVTKPTVKKNDFVVYTVSGFIGDKVFCVERRYSDFEAFRSALADRFGGLYVPNIPSKKAIGNTKQSFVEERCFLLSMFMKQVSRCAYLMESAELLVFVRPQSNNLQREMTLIPFETPESMLAKIKNYYRIDGEVSET